MERWESRELKALLENLDQLEKMAIRAPREVQEMLEKLAFLDLRARREVPEQVACLEQREHLARLGHQDYLENRDLGDE